MMQDGQTRSPPDFMATAGPASASPSSSLSSLVSAGSLLPVALSTSSHSDIAFTDSCDSQASPTDYKPSRISDTVFPVPRSSSLSAMGQSQSRVQASPPPLPPAASFEDAPVIPGALSTGQKLKRALAGRRKKSEDSSKAASQPSTPSRSKQKDKERGRHDSSSSQWGRGPSLSSLSLTLSRQSKQSTTSRQPSSAKQLTFHLASSTMGALRGRKNSMSGPQPPPSPLPPLPPKPPGHIASLRKSNRSSDNDDTLPISLPQPKVSDGQSDRRGSKDVTSLVDTRTSELMTSDDAAEGMEVGHGSSQSTEVTGNALPGSAGACTDPSRRREKMQQQTQGAEEAEDWRKSDSTMHTVRLVGSRTPRPLSVAESSHSGQTVMPALVAPGNKRLSAFMIEAEFVMPKTGVEEEAQFADTEPDGIAEGSSFVRRAPPSSPTKSSHRRSLSLNLGSLAALGRSDRLDVDDTSFESIDTTSSPVSATFGGYRMAMARQLGGSAKDSPTLTKAAANGIITPLSSSAEISSPTSSNNFRGRLAAWTATKASQSSVSLATTTTSSHGDGVSGLSSAPVGKESSSDRSVSSQSKGLKLTAISMTNGIAKGFGKRAANTFGRAWGNGSMSSTSSVHSSMSSASNATSTSAAPPSSFFSARLGRSHSGQSAAAPVPSTPHSAPAANGRHRQRKHKQSTPSGTWSVGSSSGGTSDGDAMPPLGPHLGKLMRRPMSHNGGLVFGRDLAGCVLETAVESFRFADGSPTGYERSASEQGMGMGSIGAHALETRQIPALVYRCAQHLEKWGVQEEGLFRISGRPSHVAKLRAEFDTGADWDMSECGPGEIDPHAVASVFRAYLRELPEPLLTRMLSPYFDAAISTEHSVNAAAPQMGTIFTIGMSGPTLPSGPKLGSAPLPKRPSLSTFALPNLSTRAPSESLLNALTALIAKLPPENRDLLRTVAELIKVTAKRSSVTKMPLSNLLLVFCPSLSMSPPLLKVLCESEDIWDGPPKEAEEIVVVDNRNEDTGSGVGAKPPSLHDDERCEKSGADPTDVSTVDEEALQDIWRQSLALGTSNTGSRPPSAIPIDPPQPAFVKDDDESTEGSSESSLVDSMPTRLSIELDAVTSSPEIDPMKDDEMSSNKCDLDPARPVSYHKVYDSYSTSSMVSSTESLNTPSNTSSSGDPPTMQSSPITPEAPLFSVMRTQSDLPPPMDLSSSKSILIRKSMISAPISFPISGSVPTTPVTERTNLTLSTFSSSSPELGPSAASPTRVGRFKRPSLTLLLHKRSISSLLTRTLSSAPLSARSMESTESYSTPPQSSVLPVLDMPFEHFPLNIGLGIDNNDDVETDTHIASPYSPAHTKRQERDSLAVPISSNISRRTSIMEENASFLDFSRASSTSSAYAPTIFYTPLMDSRRLELPSQAPYQSRDSYALLDVELPKGDVEEADEWTKSVLMAADGKTFDGDLTNI